MAKSVAVIICAAGAGKRFGGRRKKPFVDVARRAAFMRSIEPFADRDDVQQILLAIPREEEEIVTVKWGANLKFFNVKICFGGDERPDTVLEALKLVKDNIELIAVHDAVRCCLTKEWVDKCVAAAAKTGAAILACPIAATVKELQDNTIVGTVDRTRLYEAQTPQIFAAELLRRGYANLDNLDKSKISDDAQLVEVLGQKVSIVETDSTNIKITRPGDIAVAEAIIKSRPKPVPKGPLGPYAEAEW